MGDRRENAFATRQQAATKAKNRIHPNHISNADEQKFRSTANNGSTPSYLMSFTKGLPHDENNGLLENPQDFPLFVKAIDSGDFRDFRDTPLGDPRNKMGTKLKPEDFNWVSDKAKFGRMDCNGSVTDRGRVSVRAWESQSAGLAFDLEGPDAQAVTMPPHPELGSDELDAEMAEVYAQALLRDLPFNALTVGVMGIGSGKDKTDISTNSALNDLDAKKSDVTSAKDVTDCLNQLAWFQPNEQLDLNPQEMARRRNFVQTPANAFRGITRGDAIGPYISQFLLAGNSGINGFDAINSPSDGLITYGSITIDQRVRAATPGLDYMTTWEEWLDVQNGADVRFLECYQENPGKRFIHTPRDLATYVHYDALYEAYLNACLIMLSMGIPFDPGIPFQASDNCDHQQGFAHFGGPHILSLVTEVATRALKAVRFQKFNVHRRCRPEVLAARIEKVGLLQDMAPELANLSDNLDNAGILSKVAGLAGNHLLPMAFCEGSPMHPAYGAGHATVAGACVTILKAFFDHKHPLNIVPVGEAQQEVHDLINTVAPGVMAKSSNLAYISVQNGKKLDIVPVLDQDCKLTELTVEGELNKLASNISIGRDWAGVHYFTDYYESILMGEEIAIGILEEQKLTFGENFSMTLAKFDGTSIRI